MKSVNTRCKYWTPCIHWLKTQFCLTAPTCPTPSITSNLIIRSQQGPYDVGLVIKFSCENGFNIMGEENAICTKDLEWNVDFPTCVAAPTSTYDQRLCDLLPQNERKIASLK